MTSSLSLSPATPIPDLLRAAPAARAVLDRYGLRGCGGPLGPRESVEFFARTHDVPLDRLLAELRTAAQVGPATADPAAPPAARWTADAIYRPFFLAGIAVVLTLGAVWGAYLLVRIATTGRFAAAGLHEVNAHGHAQVFGWVGLFIMGFAYQAFPRLLHTTLRFPRLAWLSFGLMLGGLVARAVAEPLAGGWDGFARAAVAAGGAEVTAVGLFALVLAATWRASGRPFTVSDGYIASALVWFAVMAVYETVYAAATFRAGPGELVPLVGVWQGALRDLQVHGFAALMILGVGQRKLPHVYGFPEPSRRLARWCLAGINLAVAGEATGLVLMRLHDRAWAGVWYASVLLLTGCAAALVRNWRVFGPAPGTDRTRKFVRAAYAWLLVSLGMLVLLPVYQFVLLPAAAPTSPAAKIGFSHAYYGAARHAVTVGFVSLMIVGIAAKVVPILRGADPDRLPRLWVPFVLLNLGCGLRVVGQTATDFTEWAFPVAGVSGCLEVTGLAIWGGHLASLMLRPAGWERAAGLGSRPLVGTDTVAAVLDRHPDLLPVFLAFGFRPLANPVLRRTAARGVSLALACRIVGVNLEEFLAALNARLPARGPQTFALPVLT